MCIHMHAYYMFIYINMYYVHKYISHIMFFESDDN